MVGDSSRRTTLRVALLILVSMVGPPAAVAQTSPLFSPVGASLQQPSSPDPNNLTIRSQQVAVDFGLLGQIRDLPSSRVELNVFPDRTLVGVINQTINRAAATFTLVGAIDGEPGSSVFLSINQNILIGEVRTAAKPHYQIRYVRDGVHEVREIEDSRYPACGGGVPVALPPGPSTPASPSSFDDGSQIDVLVVYTPAARAAAGGTSAIEAIVNLAVDETNTAYANSLITPRVRLVFQQEIAYTESGDYQADLSNLRGTSDGFMDEVHALRDLVGADMVSLFFVDSSVCGSAYLMTSLSQFFASYAFSVVTWSCATGNYTFGHELGHNMGSHHAVGDSGLTRGESILFTYSYGWRFNSDQDRTIMAYAPGTRRMHFSNPDVTFNGSPTGVPIGDPDEAHNAQSINNAANTVANWRLAAPPVPTSVPTLQPRFIMHLVAVMLATAIWMLSRRRAAST